MPPSPCVRCESLKTIYKTTWSVCTIWIVRAIDFGDYQLALSGQCGDLLLIGIIRTFFYLGYCLISWNCPHNWFRMRSTNWNCRNNWFRRRSISWSCPDNSFWRFSISWNCPGRWYGNCPLLGVVWTIDSGHFQSIELAWTVGSGRVLLIWIVWTIELDEFQLSGIRDHNRQSIAIGNY